MNYFAFEYTLPVLTQDSMHPPWLLSKVQTSSQLTHKSLKKGRDAVDIISLVSHSRPAFYGQAHGEWTILRLLWPIKQSAVVSTTSSRYSRFGEFPRESQCWKNATLHSQFFLQPWPSFSSSCHISSHCMEIYACSLPYH